MRSSRAACSTTARLCRLRAAREPADILAAYRADCATRLRPCGFVHANFELAATGPQRLCLAPGQPIAATSLACGRADATSAGASPRSSFLQLPHPYVVPGGRFGELYYWDSYFTLLGLAGETTGPRVRDMLENFAYLIDTYGHVPNGTRSYYLGRSSPPVFALMVELGQSSASVYAIDFLPQLRRSTRGGCAAAEGLPRPRPSARGSTPGGALFVQSLLGRSPTRRAKNPG